MNPPTRLYLLRHGEVEERYHRVFGGRLDIGLSPIGEQQAVALANHLQGVHFDALYVSPLQRAQRTAQPLLGLNGHQPVTHAGLREVDFGIWTGRTWEGVSKEFGRSAYNWLAEIEAGDIPEGETGTELLDRVGRVLLEVQSHHPAQTAALVCHGGVIRAALAFLLELPLSRMASFEIDYASVTIVDWHDRRPEIQLLNYAPWKSAP